MKQLVGIPKEFYKAIAWEGLMNEDVRGWNTKSAGFFYFSAAAELEKKGSCRVIVFAEAEENWEIPWLDSCTVGRRLF
jgi:hypothetical protein